MTAQFRRFRGLARGALPLLIIVFLADAVRFAGWGLTTLVWADLLVVLLLAIVIGKDVYKPQEKQSLATQRRVAGLVVLLLLVSALIQAAFDVTLAQGGQLSALLVRWIHISAFGLWLGGAVWNIFIAVPAARETVSVPVVVAAGKQLERFRVAVRIFLPALLLSGLVQTYRYIGLNVSALWASSFGLLILAKIGLVVALVVIFITCPLWRACSPIAGMCKLDDLPRPKSDVKQA